MKRVVYLINLDGSTERMNSARQQLEAQGIDFLRVAAFDGRGVVPSEHPQCDGEAALRYMGRPLRGGEIGCYLSHLDCAQRFLATDCDVAVVLEDDCQLVAGMAQLLDQALEKLVRDGTQWSVINIGALKRKIYTEILTLSPLADGHQLSHAHYFPMTTTGLVWSRQGAQAFVSNHNRIWMPVDNFLRHWLTRSGGGLSIWPPLVRPMDLGSDIDGDGLERKLQNRSRFYGWRKQKRLWSDKFIAIWHKYFASSKT